MATVAERIRARIVNMQSICKWVNASQRLQLGFFYRSLADASNQNLVHKTTENLVRIADSSADDAYWHSFVFFSVAVDVRSSCCVCVSIQFVSFGLPPPSPPPSFSSFPSVFPLRFGFGFCFQPSVIQIGRHFSCRPVATNQLQLFRF